MSREATDACTSDVALERGPFLGLLRGRVRAMEDKVSLPAMSLREATSPRLAFPRRALLSMRSSSSEVDRASPSDRVLDTRNGLHRCCRT
jgi:hypothetical protein